MEINLVKGESGFIPFDPESEEFFEKKDIGDFFSADITKPRNNQFHKKFFALLKVAYPHWKPAELSTEYGIVEKSFSQFRKDLTILAGYYDQVFRLDNSVRIEAKSISFGAMEEEDFKVFYDRIIDVLIKHVLIGWTIEEVDREIGGFL